MALLHQFQQSSFNQTPVSPIFMHVTDFIPVSLILLQKQTKKTAITTVNVNIDTTFTAHGVKALSCDIVHF